MQHPDNSVGFPLAFFGFPFWPGALISLKDLFLAALEGIKFNYRIASLGPNTIKNTVNGPKELRATLVHVVTIITIITLSKIPKMEIKKIDTL